MFRRTLLVLVVVLLSGVALAQDFEGPRTYKAKDTVPPDLRGRHDFTVQDTVTTDGYLYRFNVESQYGTYDVRGIASLRMLASELLVLADLMKYSRSKAFVDAAGSAGIDIALAPVKTIENLADAALNPTKTLDTISKIPAGVAGVFSWASGKVEKGYESASSAVRGSASERQTAQKKVASDVEKSATTAVLDYAGYNEEEMAWYKKYGLDPWTTNKPLRDRISKIVQVETAVHIGAKFVPGVMGLGVLSTINSGLKMADQISVYADPQTVFGKDRTALRELGVSEAETDQILKNKAFTPTTLSLLVRALQNLKGVENRPALLTPAHGIESPEGAIFLVQSLTYLAVWQREKKDLQAVIPDAKIPAVRTKEGVIVVPLAVDRILWTEGAAAVLSRIAKESGSHGVSVFVSGTVSERFKAEAAKLGVRVSTGVPMPVS